MQVENGKTLSNRKIDHDQKIKAMEAQISTLDSASEDMKEKIMADTARAAERTRIVLKDNRSLKARNAHLSAVRTEAGIVMDTISAEIDSIKDVIIVNLETEIDSLVNDKQRQFDFFNKTLEIEADKYLVQVAISESWKAEAEHAQKKNGRLEKLSKILGISTGALAVILALVIAL